MEINTSWYTPCTNDFDYVDSSADPVLEDDDCATAEYLSTSNEGNPATVWFLDPRLCGAHLAYTPERSDSTSSSVFSLESPAEKGRGLKGKINLRSASVSQQLTSADDVHDPYSGRGKSNTPRPAIVPRPPNSFILYRRDCSRAIIAEHLARGETISNIRVSRLVGERWANETKDVKEKYSVVAEECRRKHGEMYPGYKYTPRKVKPRRGKREHNEYQIKQLKKPKTDIYGTAIGTVSL
ncbi:hypothetical protein HDU93_006552 [Gonapodya sp. JEL0774]|nr:hypothetical protein HDU93_006552 [Gonapodya sp. JEL0774]